MEWKHLPILETCIKKWDNLVPLNQMVMIHSIRESRNSHIFLGILGLAYSALSDGVPTFFDQLVSSKNLSNIFSMCFGDENGALVLGGIEPKYYTGSIVYTPIIR
jgi:hypothetical protein